MKKITALLICSLFVSTLVLAQAAAAPAAAPAADAPAAKVAADRPPDFVPFGAYLSWERPGACAAFYKVDRWVDVCRRLDALRDNHVNLLWVTNMDMDDLPRLIEECRTRKIKLLPSMSTIEAKVDDRWAPNFPYYDAVFPALLKLAGGSPDTLIGWVLSDEPTVEQLPRLETLRLRFRELDPRRFCTAVTMWLQTPQAARATQLPVICVDLYPFFGPNDPNGPNTDDTSKSFFRRNAKAMVDAIGKRDAVGWVMGMCFSDVWGPRRYAANGHMIGLPGAYLHWRCPSLAEMRWQVWETLRCGAKGFVCYTLAPEAPDPKTEKLPAADVTWKDVLTKTEADMGPNALTNPDGSATPQLAELGRTYALLTPHAALIRHWRLMTDAPDELETVGDGRVQTFADPTTKGLYAVVLNDNLHQELDITVRVGEKIEGLTDIVSGRSVELTRDFAGGSAAGVIHLPAGAGTILALRQEAPPSGSPK